MAASVLQKGPAEIFFPMVKELRLPHLLNLEEAVLACNCVADDWIRHWILSDLCCVVFAEKCVRCTEHCTSS